MQKQLGSTSTEHKNGNKQAREHYMLVEMIQLNRAIQQTTRVHCKH